MKSLICNNNISAFYNEDNQVISFANNYLGSGRRFSKFNNNMTHYFENKNFEFWTYEDSKKKKFYYVDSNRIVFQYNYTRRYIYIRFRDSNGDNLMKIDRFKNGKDCTIKEKEKIKWMNKFKHDQSIFRG